MIMGSSSLDMIYTVLKANSITASEEENQALYAIGEKFKKVSADFNGPTAADVTIGQVMAVIEKASVEAGDGGTWVSQFGNKQWL